SSVRGERWILSCECGARRGRTSGTTTGSILLWRTSDRAGGSPCALAAGAGLAGAEPVGLGAGFEDVGVEGDPVDDRGDEAGVGGDGFPFAGRPNGCGRHPSSFLPLRS